MKVQITMKIKATNEVMSIELVVRPSDTVACVKEKFAGVQPVPFPEQEFTFNGQVLLDEAKLSQIGVSDGCDLNLEIKATEATLAQQLGELLQARDLTADELGLLYCYKHGASVNQALQLLGFEGRLQDFIAKQKTLTMENGSVSLVRVDTSLKPFSAVDEIVQILSANPAGFMEIKDLSSKFSKKFGVTLASIIGGRPVDFLSKNSLFVVHGSYKRVSLQGTRQKDMEPQPTCAPNVIADAPPGLGAGAPPGLGGDAPPGLGGHEDIVSDTDSIDSVDIQQYMDLHNRICSREFNLKMTQSINDFVTSVSESIFLDIDHVVVGGSVGKGTAISGDATAEIVFFVRGLPLSRNSSWLPPLLQAVAGTLSQNCLEAEDIQANGDSVTLRVLSPSPIDVIIYVSPAFDDHGKTMQAVRELVPESLKFCAPTFAKERTQFIARQSTSVKTTIRLMLWWRGQQQWSNKRSYPRDDILELATIYSAIQTKPKDQKTAIANVMSLLSHFSRLRVVWSNFYSKDDVSAQLLRQRPLLMDPANPFVNVADPQMFDASELMAAAQSTHFFW